jgi:phage gp36-like protein
MGNYITSTSYYLLLPGFLKDNTSASTDSFGVSMFNQQVENAESIVNASIAPYYNIAGFASTPPLLKKLTEDIAIYHIIKATGYRADDRNEYLDDYKYAMDTLSDIKEGKIKLTYSDGSLIPILSTRFFSDKDGYTPIFGLDDPTEWERDDDEISDQSGKRD